MILTFEQPGPAEREVRSRRGRTSACAGYRGGGSGVHGWTPADDVRSDCGSGAEPRRPEQAVERGVGHESLVQAVWRG